MSVLRWNVSKLSRILVVTGLPPDLMTLQAVTSTPEPPPGPPEPQPRRPPALAGGGVGGSGGPGGSSGVGVGAYKVSRSGGRPVITRKRDNY